MVECESLTIKLIMGLEKVLIDTWWNVNQSFGEEQLKEAFVLIDTWWNVNNMIQLDPEQPMVVLIDTWWNVNSKHHFDTNIIGTSFNRYMVECESFSRNFDVSSSSCFNRYMVECEY